MTSTSRLLPSAALESRHTGQIADSHLYAVVRDLFTSRRCPSPLYLSVRCNGDQVVSKPVVVFDVGWSGLAYQNDLVSTHGHWNSRVGRDVDRSRSDGESTAGEWPSNGRSGGGLLGHPYVT